MRLSSAGEIALDAWLRIDEVNSHVTLDELFIMPDHLHGIILIREDQAADEKAAPMLGILVGQFKTHSAQRINAARGTRGQPVWQRSYCEHIIRDDEDLARVRTYIANKPLRINAGGRVSINR